MVILLSPDVKYDENILEILVTSYAHCAIEVETSDLNNIISTNVYITSKTLHDYICFAFIQSDANIFKNQLNFDMFTIVLKVIKLYILYRKFIFAIA